MASSEIDCSAWLTIASAGLGRWSSVLAMSALYCPPVSAAPATRPRGNL
jgi:hypothetical protein